MRGCHSIWRRWGRYQGENVQCLCSEIDTYPLNTANNQ